MPSKQCRLCKCSFPIDMFYKQASCLGGHKSLCKNCYQVQQGVSRKINHVRVCEYAKKYRREHLEKVAEYKKTGMKRHPWYKTWKCIENRCSNPKCDSYPRYGGKGIKNKLSMADLKYLWERDNASEMARPSIDRINSKRNYTLGNCRYMELIKNLKRRANFWNARHRGTNGRL